MKRNGPSLSIVNPLEVLRQRLLLELARRKMRVSANQIQANAKLLDTVGKRDVTAQVSDAEAKSNNMEFSRDNENNKSNENRLRSDVTGNTR